MAHKKRLLTADFERSVGYWICQTAHAFENAMAAEFTGTGTTMRQVQVLACLALKGELVQKEIADMLRIEHSTAARLLDRMERDGWITRRGSTEDRRRKVIAPTRRVRATWEDIVVRADRVRRKAGRGLSPARLRAIRDDLARMRENLGYED